MQCDIIYFRIFLQREHSQSSLTKLREGGQAMESSTKKTIEDIRKQADLMIASGYSVTTTSHVLGVHADVLKKWMQSEKLALKSPGRKFARKM